MVSLHKSLETIVEFTPFKTSLTRLLPVFFSVRQPLAGLVLANMSTVSSKTAVAFAKLE